MILLFYSFKDAGVGVFVIKVLRCRFGLVKV